MLCPDHMEDIDSRPLRGAHSYMDRGQLRSGPLLFVIFPVAICVGAFLEFLWISSLFGRVDRGLLGLVTRIAS